MEGRSLMRGREAAEPPLHPWRDILLFASVALAVAGAVALLGVGLHALGADRETANGMELRMISGADAIADGSQSRCSDKAPERLSQEALIEKP